MKKIVLFLILLGSQVFAQTVTSPVPNLSNEISLNKSLTYVYIYNSGTQPITTSLSIPVNPNGISIAVNRCASIKAKNTCYIVINFSGYKISLPTLSVSLLNNSSLLTTLKYNANNIESISVNPTSLSLGTITTVGLTSAQTVTVQNTGNIAISPIVSSSNPNLQISSNSCLNIIAPSNTCSFNVRYNAQNSTPNGALSGLSVGVAPSSSGTVTQIPVSGLLDLQPVLVAVSENISSGGSVSADKYVFVQGNSSKAYNPTSNIFYSWGGNAATTSPNSPVPVSIGANLGGKYLKKIASSNSHNCAIASDDKVYCWGVGILGYDYTITYPNTLNIPTPVKNTGALAGKTIKEIGVGQNISCAIASDNLVYCWGDNGYGAMGINDSAVFIVDEPTQIYMGGALAGKTIKSLNVEQYGVCVIASDDLVYCWGTSLATNTVSYAPEQIPMTGSLTGKTVKSLYTSNITNCLIASDDKPYCWGTGGSGQFSTSLLENSLVPIPIALGGLSGKIIKEIHAGGNAMYALTEDNKVFSWGTNYYGALGLGPSSDQYTAYEPTEIYMSGALAGKTIKSLYSGPDDSIACVIASDNQAYCWGRNGNGGPGILGIGLTYLQLNFTYEPVAVFTGGDLIGKQIKSLHLAPYQNIASICALASDNNVYCWGSNTTGALGNGTYTSSSVPVLAPTP